MRASDLAEMRLPASAVLIVAGLSRASRARSMAAHPRRANSFLKRLGSMQTLTPRYPVRPSTHRPRWAGTRKISDTLREAAARRPRCSCSVGLLPRDCSVLGGAAGKSCAQDRRDPLTERSHFRRIPQR